MVDYGGGIASGFGMLWAGITANPWTVIMFVGIVVGALWLQLRTLLIRRSLIAKRQKSGTVASTPANDSLPLSARAGVNGVCSLIVRPLCRRAWHGFQTGMMLGHHGPCPVLILARARALRPRRCRHIGSVVRMSPQFTHDHATRNLRSSRISNVRGSPQVGHVRGSAAGASMSPA